MVIEFNNVLSPSEFREWFFDLPRDSWEYKDGYFIVNEETSILIKLKFGEIKWQK